MLQTKIKKSCLVCVVGIAAVLGVILWPISARAMTTHATTQLVLTIESGGLKFKVYPEKRVPPTGNWGTLADLTLYECQTGEVIETFEKVPTDEEGVGNASGASVTDGNYKIHVRGASHLNKDFGCVVISQNFVDLTKNDEELLSGEISVVYDNYVNSLDVSVLAVDLYTDDYYSDLNQDGKVNSLDLSNQVYNLFKNGDV